MKAKQSMERNRWSRRPNFAPRQLLTARQLNVGLEDELERQRLLNRALHGNGVVFGFGLETDEDGVLVVDRGCVELTCGLALDHHGRMLYWRGGRIGMNDIVGELPDCEGRYTLRVHYAERTPRPDGCLPFSSDDSRWRDQGVVFTLRPDCQPADRSCPAHPDGSCLSHDDYLCQRTGAVPGSHRDTLPASEDLDWACVEPGALCPTGCGDWGYDPDVCVPLACVEICDLTRDYGDHKSDDHESGEEYDSRSGPEGKKGHGPDPKHPDPHQPHCDPKYGFCSAKPDVCEVRPFVYRSPLLYELLNCCDVELARVGALSWSEWLDGGGDPVVPWAEFEQRVLSKDEGFAIWFTKPIEIATLHLGSIVLSAVYKEERTDYWMVQRVPLEELRPLRVAGGYAKGVQLIFESDWIAAEVTGRRSTLFEGARFELTVRGQLLRDECGQMLDARPLDIDGAARCQDRPGGDFLSVFLVGPRDDNDY